MKAKLKAFLEEYGQTAIVVYLVIFVLVLAGFAAAIYFGVQLRGVSGAAGTLVGAWVATKLTQPIRIAATLALTPLVVTLLRKLRTRTGR